MTLLGSATTVNLVLGSTDMRKSINGLSLIVADHLERDVFSGHLFVFCNQSKTIIKILYWDRNGFCLWQKPIRLALTARAYTTAHSGCVLGGQIKPLFKKPVALARIVAIG